MFLDKKLNSFGCAPKFSPIKYGNFGFLKLSNGSVASSVIEDSRVEKYAYIPFGYSGVTPYLPLFSSK